MLQSATLLSIVLFAVHCFSQKLSHGPVLDLPDPAVSYHGQVKEDETIVDVTPEIKIIDGTGPVCSYILHGSRLEDERIPFEVVVDDRQTGLARIRVQNGETLDCEKRKMYKLVIFAKHCNDSSLSKSAILTIDVRDVNEFAPEFAESWYEVTVDEGKIYDQLQKLDAHDRDCSKKYSEVCRYEITNNAAPFAIDATGVLRNTEPLNYTQSRSHLITVVAIDCGMKSSKEIVVTVNVLPSCAIGWHGFPPRADFIPGSEAVVLAPNAKLDLCDLHCTVEAMNSSISLHSEYASKGCDRDTFAMKSQRQLCGMHADTIELLPSAKDVRLENEVPSTVSDEESADEVYLFDGHSNAVTVSETAWSEHLPEKFTTTFWLKHATPKTSEDLHSSGKESILCVSDDHKMNRHHFAIFIRNCKLEMLLRRVSPTADVGGTNTFKPAEWRWHLPEVCDDEWHQYAISVEFPQVTLFVDGRHVQENAAEVLDDWPMREAGLKTRAVVGACWQGKVNRMSQFLKGSLSGLTFLANRVEATEAIECLHRCRESLEFDGLDRLRPGMEAIFNTDMSRVYLKAGSESGLASLVQRVKYVNSRTAPSPGHRLVDVETSLKCQHMDKAITLPQTQMTILVQKVPDPELIVAGVQQVKEVLSAIRDGVKIFPDVKLTVRDQAHAIQARRRLQKIELCRISATPPLNKSVEYLSVPASLLTNNGLDFQQTETALELKGSETEEKYEEVLQHLQYYNKRSIADTLRSRKFMLSCSMLHGRVVSSGHGVQLVVIREVTVPPTTEVPKNPASLAHERKEATMKLKQDFAEHPPAYHSNKRHKAEAPLSLVHDAGFDAYAPQGGSVETAGSAVAVVVIVCIGFLVLLVVVGVWRVRAAGNKPGKRGSRRASTKDGDALAWDDSGMNITVNPLEQEMPSVKTETTKGNAESDESDSEGDCDSLKDDEVDEEYSDDEEASTVLPHAQTAKVAGGKPSTGLEWDDSTLNGSPGRQSLGARSQTYRV